MHPEHNEKLPRVNRIEGQLKGIKKMIELYLGAVARCIFR